MAAEARNVADFSSAKAALELMTGSQWIPDPGVLEAAAPRLNLARLKPGLDVSAIDPDHHLWLNGRRWWCSFSVVVHGWQQRRVRVSLSTAQIAQARRRRDGLLALLDECEECQVSLRFRRMPLRKDNR
jgi:hypothetical protein